MSDDNRAVAPSLRSHQQTRAAYDRLSRWYDWISGNSEKPARDRALRTLEPQSGERVLEIGLGTGQSLVHLATVVGDTGKVYGIDLSPRMLDVARARVHRAGLERRVELENGDAIQLPFGADFFDAIFMSFVLELFDTREIPRVTTECHRVLRMGGRICVLSLSKAGGPSRARDAYEWIHIKLPGIVDCRPIYPERALASGGFHVVQTVPSTLWGLAIEIVLAKKPV